MNVKEYMKKYGLTDEMLDVMAKPYEDGSFESESGEIFYGSHLDAVGKKRITVVYDAEATQKVKLLAQRRGCSPSEVYRDALEQYLAEA